MITLMKEMIQMTREEAIERAYNNETEHLIDTIYDYFESRKCESCRTYYKDESCPIYYEAYNLHFAESPKDFSCNKWEKKDD